MVQDHSGFNLQGEIELSGATSEPGQVLKGQGAGNTPIWGFDDYGMSFRGTVTSIAGAPAFNCSGLIGFGDDFFKGYWAYVVWNQDTPGAAPQGELLECTGYTSTTGLFTVDAYTVGIAVDDVVLFLHPGIAATNQLPNVQHETEWVTTPTIQLVSDAAAVTLSVGSITPTYPTGSTLVRAILIATIHVANKTAVAHHIKFKVEGQKAGGGYGNLVDLTAQEGLSMVDVDGATDGWSGAIDVTGLVDTDGAVYDFRFEVDSDDAGNVIYICSFVLALVYTM